MRRILALTRLTIAGTLRLRGMLAILLFLALVVVGLPFAIKGDGTPAGDARILLSYTLGLSLMLLCIGALWSGCAAVAVEIAEKQAHLLVTKPVHRLQIWVGKWLGLLVVHGSCLAFCAVLVYGMVTWKNRPAAVGAETHAALYQEILVARKAFAPDTRALERELEQRMARVRRENPDLPEHELREGRTALRRTLFNRASTVAPGDTLQWRIELPPAAGDHAILLRFTLTTPAMGSHVIRAAWTAGPAGTPPVYRHEGSYVSRQPHAILLPAEAAEGGTLEVTFTNVETEHATTCILNPDNGLEALVYVDSFAFNLFRTWWVLFAQVAFMCALGLTAGSLFSTPVAVFVAGALALLVQFGGYVGQVAESEVLFEQHTHGPVVHEEPTLFEHVLLAFFKGLDLLLAPLQNTGALDRLATGRMVSWGLVAHGLAYKVVLVGALFGLFAGWILKRREIGLPS